jgi:hypothetical protein
MWIRIGSGYNCVTRSGIGYRSRKKKEKHLRILCFEDLDVPSGGLKASLKSLGVFHEVRK